MNTNFYMGIVLHFLQWLVRSYGAEVFFNGIELLKYPYLLKYKNIVKCKSTHACWSTKI